MHGARKLTCRALKVSWGLREASPLKCARRITPARTGQLKWPARQTVSCSIIPAHALSISPSLSAPVARRERMAATQLRPNHCSACFSHQVRKGQFEKRDRGSAQLLGRNSCTEGRQWPSRLTYASGQAMHSAGWQGLAIKLDVLVCGVDHKVGVPGSLALLCAICHAVQVDAFPLPGLPLQAVQQQAPYCVPLRKYQRI
jgi:hypothetical protein